MRPAQSVLFRLFERAPPASDFEYFIRQSEQALPEAAAAVESFWHRIALRQVEWTNWIANFIWCASDHFKEVEFDGSQFAFNPFQFSSDFRIAFSYRIQERSANESRTEDRFTVSVFRIATCPAHDSA